MTTSGQHVGLGVLLMLQTVMALELMLRLTTDARAKHPGRSTARRY